jgi:outer membrane receptor protein involved in Fe transport
MNWYVGVNNLLDEEYYAHRASTGGIYPGMPRTFAGGMGVKF